ncbi:MAG: hypothetical protein ACPG4Z_08700 [Chitinophagales bacterium]
MENLKTKDKELLKIIFLHIMDRNPGFGSYYGLSQILERILISPYYRHHKVQISTLVEKELITSVKNGCFYITEKGKIFLEENKSKLSKENLNYMLSNNSSTINIVFPFL